MVTFICFCNYVHEMHSVTPNPYCKLELKHAVRRQNGGIFFVFHVLCGMTHFLTAVTTTTTPVAVALVALRNEVD